MRQVLILIIVILVWFGCKPEKRNTKNAVTENKGNIVKKPTLQDSVEQASTKILTALKNKDYPAFAATFHPVDGVRFSPYGYIDPTHKHILGKDFSEAIAKNWTLTWGHYDGSGEAIKLKVKPYIEQYIYNADYLNADEKSFDDFIGKGNTINNLKESYPNLHFIEYYFKGKDEKNKGLDWTSLKLVFKKLENQYYLVAIIHDQWTI
ncbi:hypothetical protein ACJVDH_20190 [Pedobacter sp. AW1-32]|uniref:hypothetical protein n=1 Tax=Pedobacter sp. AW1-32 TaxID=3383026 RepID=UPI003FF0F806